MCAPGGELSLVGQNLLHDRHQEFNFTRPQHEFRRGAFLRSDMGVLVPACGSRSCGALDGAAAGGAVRAQGERSRWTSRRRSSTTSPSSSPGPTRRAHRPLPTLRRSVTTRCGSLERTIDGETRERPSPREPGAPDARRKRRSLPLAVPRRAEGDRETRLLPAVRGHAGADGERNQSFREAAAASSSCGENNRVRFDVNVRRRRTRRDQGQLAAAQGRAARATRARRSDPPRFRQLPIRRKLIAMIMVTSLAVAPGGDDRIPVVDYFVSRDDLRQEVEGQVCCSAAAEAAVQFLDPDDAQNTLRDAGRDRTCAWPVCTTSAGRSSRYVSTTPCPASGRAARRIDVHAQPHHGVAAHYLEGGKFVGTLYCAATSSMVERAAAIS